MIENPTPETVPTEYRYIPQNPVFTTYCSLPISADAINT